MVEDQAAVFAEDASMSSRTRFFDVRVRARSEHPVETIPWDSGAKYAKSVRIYQIEARTPEQACQVARKYGTPIGCRKVDLSAAIERKMTIGPPSRIPAPLPVSPFQSAIAMDELRWNRRVKRIANDKKHRSGY